MDLADICIDADGHVLISKIGVVYRLHEHGKFNLFLNLVEIGFFGGV